METMFFPEKVIFHLAVSDKKYKINGKIEKGIKEIPRVASLMEDFKKRGLTTEIEFESHEEAANNVVLCYLRYKPTGNSVFDPDFYCKTVIGTIYGPEGNGSVFWRNYKYNSENMIEIGSDSNEKT